MTTHTDNHHPFDDLTLLKLRGACHQTVYDVAEALADKRTPTPDWRIDAWNAMGPAGDHQNPVLAEAVMNALASGDLSGLMALGFRRATQ